MKSIDMAKLSTRHRGFSLVEMAVVVVLMSIFLTLGMAAFNAQVGSAALSTTKKKQEIIRDALVAYLRDFKRLPCPEVTAFAGNAPTGVEGRQTAGNPATNCASFWGTIPYTDLGLSRDVALDGYENFFTYYVSSAQSTAEPNWAMTSAVGVPGFGVGNPGRFAITENGTATTLSKNLATVVIVSHGSNGLGAFTSKGTRNVLPADGTDERKNAPDTAGLPILPAPWASPSQVAVSPPALPSPGIKELIAHDRTETPAPFDDLVLALRPNDLLAPVIRDGAMRSADALVQDQLAVARDTAIAQMLANSCAPVGSVANLPTDPWGTPILYQQVTTTQLTTSSAAALALSSAFRIWSAGEDRVSNAGSGDDRVMTTGLNVTYGQILTRISLSTCP